VTTTDTTATAAPDTAKPLPAYTGADTVCVMCSHPSAYTRYQSERYRVLREVNGRPERHARLTARLERQCQNCDYQWDEALNPAPAVRTATVEDMATALQHSHQGWALDLSPGCAEHMADALLRMFHVQVRPDHPLWKQHVAPRPLLAVPADVVTLTDPAISPLPIVVTAPGDRPQPTVENRPAPPGTVAPVPPHEKPQPPEDAPAPVLDPLNEIATGS